MNWNALPGDSPLWHTGSRDAFRAENPNDVENAAPVFAPLILSTLPRFRLRLRQGHLQGRLRDRRPQRVEQDRHSRPECDAAKCPGGHRHRPAGKVRRQVHDPRRRCVQRPAVARAGRRTEGHGRRRLRHLHVLLPVHGRAAEGSRQLLLLGGHSAAEIQQRHDLVGRAERRRRDAHQIRHGEPRAQRHGVGGGFRDRQMAPVGDAHPLVGGQGQRQHAALVRRRAGARQEAEDQRPRVRLLLPARNPSQSAPSLGRHDLLRQFHPRRHAGRGREVRK